MLKSVIPLFEWNHLNMELGYNDVEQKVILVTEAFIFLTFLDVSARRQCCIKKIDKYG